MSVDVDIFERFDLSADGYVVELTCKLCEQHSKSWPAVGQFVELVDVMRAALAHRCA